MRCTIKKIYLTFLGGCFITGLISTNALAMKPVVELIEVEKVRIEEEVVRTSDNFIVLFDASGSMQDTYKDTGIRKIELAERLFKTRTTNVPDLGWNAGLYLYTPWKNFYGMERFEKNKFVAAIDEMHAYKPSVNYRSQPTPLGNSLKKLDPILANLTGQTVVFVFSDGQFTTPGRPKILPVPTAKDLASKHNVCFYVISSADSPKSEKVVNDIAAVNTCSRVVTFDTLLNRPEYLTGALYMVKDKAIVDTELVSKVVGVELDNILFDFDRSEIRLEYKDELDSVASFLKDNPEAYVVIEGFTDSIGKPEYNLNLSRKRAETAKNYLTKSFNLPDEQVVAVWYGKELPVASNDTEEGRQLNRRVRLLIRGLD